MKWCDIETGAYDFLKDTDDFEVVRMYDAVNFQFMIMPAFFLRRNLSTRIP